MTVSKTTDKNGREIYWEIIEGKRKRIPKPSKTTRKKTLSKEKKKTAKPRKTLSKGKKELKYIYILIETRFEYSDTENVYIKASIDKNKLTPIMKKLVDKHQHKNLRSSSSGVLHHIEKVQMI